MVSLMWYTHQVPTIDIRYSLHAAIRPWVIELDLPAGRENRDVGRGQLVDVSGVFVP